MIEIDHGKRSTYNKACRCKPCRAANALHQRDLRAKAPEKHELRLARFRARVAATAPHDQGRYSWYTIGDCRCDGCRAAARQHKRAKRSRIATAS